MMNVSCINVGLDCNGQLPDCTVTSLSIGGLAFCRPLGL